MCNGGFNQVIAEFGNNIASLEIMTSAKRVLITDTQEQY